MDTRLPALKLQRAHGLSDTAYKCRMHRKLTAISGADKCGSFSHYTFILNGKVLL